MVCWDCAGKGRAGGLLGLFTKSCARCAETGTAVCHNCGGSGYSEDCAEEYEDGDLLFNVSIFQRPLGKYFVSRVTGMTHAYILSRFVTPSPLPLQTDFVFSALFQTCVQGLEDGTLEVAGGTLREQLVAQQGPDDAGKLMDLVRENREVADQWNMVGMFGCAPALKCLESLILDFSTDPLIILNYSALFYRGLQEHQRRRFPLMGADDAYRNALIAMGNAASELDFTEGATFAAEEMERRGL
jgi:hypothetical protein